MDYIKVGKIANTHGVRGELKVQSLTDYDERFSEGHSYYIGEEKKEVHIKSFRNHKGMLIMVFEEFDNINQCEKYKGDFLYVSKEDRYELPEDSYYVDDLIGFEVLHEGEKIGVLKEIQTSYVNDIYIVETPGGDIMIPAVKEFILEINLEDKRIFVNLIEGILE
ncbi:MAG: ribosome maturation factor RimM [Gallicola sp.]|nr:ribosome maturation factor RimM [Gallicola sp.]